MIDWIRRLFSTRDSDVREEMQHHLDSRAEWNAAAGMESQEAQYAAKRQFGNLLRAHEDTRAVNIPQFLESVLQDARHAIRGFARTPGFTLTAITAIALAISACSAVFSVVDRILFRSLPYAHEDRLVWIGMGAPIEPDEFLLGGDYYEWRESQTPLDAFTSTMGMTDCDLTGDAPVRLGCGRVAYNFLETLGVQPVIGRDFHPDEDRPNGPHAVMLSYGLWQSRFGGSRSVLQQQLEVDGERIPIVGVLPAGFELPTLAHPDLLMPQRLDEKSQRERVTQTILRGFGRLKPGVSLEQARAQMQPLFQKSLQSVPPQFRKEVSLKVSYLRERQVRDSRLASIFLLAAVGCVLLIACANVANLMLARGAARDRERSVREALGAGKARLARQSLIESLILAIAGGIAGIAGGTLLLKTLTSIAPKGIPRLAEAHLDVRVLAVSLAATIVCGVAFGLGPALAKSRVDLLHGTRLAGSPHTSLRNLLVSTQVALSIVLLAGAGLLLKSLWKLENVPLGLNPEHVAVAPISLNRAHYKSQPEQIAFFETLEQRARSLPGVQAAAVADSVPPGGRTMSMIFSIIRVQGRPAPGKGTGGMVVHRFVTPDYFRALEIPILAGRPFTTGDRTSGEQFCILSSSLARKLFPREQPLGQHLRFGLEGPWRTVVGIAGEVKNAGVFEQQDPEYYEPLQARPDFASRHETLILRTNADPRLTTASVRDIVQQLDPHVPVEVEMLPRRVGSFIARPRFNTLVLTVFAAIGLVLAAVGLYGVLAFLVAQRSQEIGVRMALGATGHQIRKMVFGYAARWTLLGAIAGIVAALLCSRYVASLLYNVPPKDPATLVSVCLVLAFAAGLAALLPSLRASRLDPMKLLRHD